MQVPTALLARAGVRINIFGDSGFYRAPRDSARIAAFWRLAIRAIRDSNNPAGGGGIALGAPNRVGREALRGGCRWRRGGVERQADLWGKEGCSVGALDESGKIVRAQGHSPQTS